jgi:hypothetical protein
VQDERALAIQHDVRWCDGHPPQVARLGVLRKDSLNLAVATRIALYALRGGEGIRD